MARYTLGGAVVDSQTYQPKADVELVVQLEGEEVARATTGDDGRFTVNLVEGDYRVEPAGVVAVPASVDVSLSNDDLTLRFEVRSGYYVGGSVTRTGVPTEGVTVTVTAAAAATAVQSDSSGKWYTFVPPGRCTIETDGVAAFEVEVTADTYDYDLEIGEGVAAGQTSVYGRVIRVTDAGGVLGVAGFEVETLLDGERIGSASTDGEGRYSLTVTLPSDKTGVVRPVDNTVACDPVEAQVVAAGANVDFILDNVSVAGRFLSGGHPVTEGTLRLEGIDDPSFSKEARSADGGVYGFSGLPGGKYRLVPVRPGGDPVELDLRSSTQRDVDVNPADPGVVVVSGVVYDSEDRLGDLTIQLVVGGEPWLQTTTDADGEFSFELDTTRLRAGEVLVRVAPTHGPFVPTQHAVSTAEGHVSGLQFAPKVVALSGQVLARQRGGAATPWEGTLTLTRDDGKPVKHFDRFTTVGPGVWMAYVPPGKYKLLPADPTRFRTRAQPLAFEAAGDSVTDLVYQLPEPF